MSSNNPLPATAQPESRTTGRDSVQLKTIVQVKESPDESWREVTEVRTISRNGAGFTLSRPCAVGRLVTLVLPMPEELRAYDHKKEVYPVMGLVQYCNAAKVDGSEVFHVGVGFIGKNVPESFKTRPMQNYRIVGMSKDGLWDITESESDFHNRKQPRYWMSMPITISLVQKEDKSVIKEETVTTNIGAGGVSVISTLDARVGSTIKVACREIDFFAFATVRNRKEADGGRVTLHLEFVDAQMPVEKIRKSQFVKAA